MASLYSLEGAYGAVQVVALVLASVGEFFVVSFSSFRFLSRSSASCTDFDFLSPLISYSGKERHGH